MCDIPEHESAKTVPRINMRADILEIVSSATYDLASSSK